MDASRDIDLLAKVAARQAGRVTRAQLGQIGIGRGLVASWIARGILIPTLPRVFAFGYAQRTRESRLWEAALYAGPGAMLSHLTAAQWCGYIKYAPQAIHVSTPRKVASHAGRVASHAGRVASDTDQVASHTDKVVVHGRRCQLIRATHEGLPVTTPEQTLLDLATVRPDLLNRALGQLDYHGGFDLEALRRAANSGDHGALGLQRALAAYDPNFALLNDEFEVDFYELCIEWGIDPLPIPNVEIAPNHFVDGLWPDHRLAVELDGHQNHSSDAHLLRDADRDLNARALGLTVIRYRRAQIKRSPDRVRRDLVGQLQRSAAQPVG